MKTSIAARIKMDINDPASLYFYFTDVKIRPSTVMQLSRANPAPKFGISNNRSNGGIYVGTAGRLWCCPLPAKGSLSDKTLALSWQPSQKKERCQSGTVRAWFHRTSAPSVSFVLLACYSRAGRLHDRSFTAFYLQLFTGPSWGGNVMPFWIGLGSASRTLYWFARCCMVLCRSCFSK